MRYKINFDKTINQLVPHYIGGRKLILFLQSLVSPLQVINNVFVEWAKETRIEASMTSQIFKFEWFLNHKFQKYFANKNSKIFIVNSQPIGVPFYNENNQSVGAIPPVLYGENEGAGGENLTLYDSTEKTAESSVSFAVHIPAVNTIYLTKDEYISMIKYQIDKYRLSGKTYTIIYNETL